MRQRKEAEKLVEIVRPYTPKHLYKYRSINSQGVEDIFVKRKIYFTDATKFDDPFECKPILTFHQSSLKRQKFLKELTKDKFPSADKKAIKKLMRGKKRLLTDQPTLRTAYEAFIKTIGIYCLSEKNDDLLMWSLYSDSHCGFCIEFDASNEHTLFWEAFKVIYQEEYPTVNTMDIGEADEFRKALLTKSTHWMHQEEWRILKTEQEGGPGLYLFSPELLTGVIMGALMCEKDRELLLSWVEQYPTEITIYQAKLNERKYQLDIVPFSEA